MADPEISQTNNTPHTPQQPNHRTLSSSSSYDAEESTESSSFDGSLESSLSGLEAACSALRLDTTSGSDTDSLHSRVDTDDSDPQLAHAVSRCCVNHERHKEALSAAVCSAAVCSTAAELTIVTEDYDEAYNFCEMTEDYVEDIVLPPALQSTTPNLEAPKSTRMLIDFRVLNETVVPHEEGWHAEGWSYRSNPDADGQYASGSDTESPDLTDASTSNEDDEFDPHADIRRCLGSVNTTLLRFQNTSALSELLQLWKLQASRAAAQALWWPDFQRSIHDGCGGCKIPYRHRDDDDDDSTLLTWTMLQLSQTNREFLAHASFIDWGDSASDAPCIKWKQICSIWDSASNTCLINPTLIRSHWEWASRDKRMVTGVGGKQTECHGIVIVPIMTTFAGKVLFVCSTVVNFHPVIDFMYGLDFQESHYAIFDPHNYRVYLGVLKETIRLDKLRKVKARLNADPIGMVSICGGCDPPLGMALMMGFKVCFYLSVEKYEHTRTVAKGIYPQIVHVEPHDLMEIDIPRLAQRIIDLNVSKVALTSGCPCTPWSRLSTTPLGFNHPLAQLVTRTAELIGLLKAAGILWKVLNETVVPHENLYKDIVHLEHIMGMPYLMHNAMCSGAVASRPRLLGLTGATVADMPKSTHLNPDMVLQSGWHFTKRPVRCLVAVGDTTRSPVIVANHQGVERFIDADERDRINPGSRAGLSTGYGAIDLSLKQRQRITGNAFSNDMLWAVMFQWSLDPPALNSAMVSTIASPYWQMTAQQAESALSVLTIPEMFAQFSSMVKADFMPRIPILVKEGHDILPFQTRAPGAVPPKLQISADYKVEQMVREGTHKRIAYSKDIWIMLLFWKPKLRSETAEFDGPNWKAGDQLEALRPLVDYRASNAAQYYHPWLIEWSPNNKLNIASIPPDTTHWADHDSKDAYHAMLLEEKGKRMGCAKYMDSQGQTIYLEPQCCQQGQASSAAWFSPWVRYGYNCFIGPHHMVWWLDFSDDSCAHGNGEAQCLTRYSILGIIKVLMGLKPQVKRSPSCSLEKHWAGLVWTIRGVCISETARLAIIEACSVIPRGVTQMRRLRGQIQSGLLGFDMNTDSLSAFVTLMIPINDAITAAESSGKFAWPEAARASQQSIIDKMGNTPKAYTHPDRILDEQHSLLQLGDGDPRAVCSGIISVPVADASDITLDMIHSIDSGAVLISIYFQTLNKHQTRWMMYEIEAFAHVVCHRQTCKFINECMAKFNYAKSDTVVPKLKYGCDNTTALGLIATFTIPDGKIEHLMAKFQRFCGWCEEFTITVYWHVCFMSVLGDHNSMFDTLVRMTAALRLRIPGMNEDSETVDALPITLMSLAETETDISSLSCASDAADCGGCCAGNPAAVCSAAVCSTAAEMDDIEVMVNTRSSSLFSPEDSADSCKAIDEMDEAPTLSAGHTGHTLKSLPNGYAIHFLGLNQAQWSCLIMTYNNDITSTYAGIRIKDIYDQLQSGTLHQNTKHAATIKAWSNKMFFLVDVGVPGMPALYTPSSQARLVHGDSPTDATKLLVPVIPDLAKIRLSTRSLSSTPFDESAPACSRVFLRDDILWLIHYRPTPHTGKVDTIKLAMRQAWWPGIEHDAELTFQYCPVCSQSRAVERSVGVGIKSHSRFTWLIIDDKILPTAIQAVTSYVSILGMVDPASGALKFRLRKTMTAMEAAVLIFCNWITQYGIPERLSSDNHGAFTADVARIICDILGITNRVFSAVYQSRSQAHIENRNRIISEVIHGAVAKGDITCDTDLELYIAEAEIKGFQMIETDGSPAFERCTGELPRTVNSSLSAPMMEADDLESCVERLNEMDAKLARSVYSRCKSLMEYKAIMSDKRARYNRANLLGKEAGRKTVRHTYTAGSMVSLGGRKVTLDRLEPADSPDPTTCWVTDRNGKSLHVRVDSLRPLAADIDERLMPKDLSWRVPFQFIIYDTPAGLSGGVISSVNPDSTIVHDYMPIACKTCVTWAPLWISVDDPDADPIRSTKCPHGCSKSLVTVPDADVISSVVLKGRRLDDDSVARLKALGHTVFDVLG